MEYGSARWGTHEDIAPYIDPLFQNNVILTKTESLTMNSRPKDPKTARNKNVLVIGGSGSGKTRFWLCLLYTSIPPDESPSIKKHTIPPKIPTHANISDGIGFL